MKAKKRGFDKHAFFIDDYVILSTTRLKLINVTTRDDDLKYFDELNETLINLKNKGVNVIPTLGYCYDEDSKDGKGYVIQKVTKWEELFDDSVMKEFYIWSNRNHENIYFYLNDIGAKEYLLTRTKFVANISQGHYDKFVNDLLILNKYDILVDCIGKSNFFYHEQIGFQFIDIDSHTDYKYGLDNSNENDNICTVLGCFMPCHLAVGTIAFPLRALDVNSLSRLSNEEVEQIRKDNKNIFEKCLRAVRNNNISHSEIEQALNMLKIF